MHYINTNMMRTEQALDYAVFQLSPNRSRCELFVSSNGSTERLASGLVKPFVAHLKIAEEQFALAAQSIKLEVEEHKPDEIWFTKGTLERFVRFVSTPEILEVVNRLDAELSQLEAARMIYSQDAADQPSGMIGQDGNSMVDSSDDSKKDFLRAIDVRLAAVKQDLTAACTRAIAAGFNPESVLELQHFASRFGAHRLSEACGRVSCVYERRPEMNNPWSSGMIENRAIRSSFSSDMSIDDSPENHRATQGLVIDEQRQQHVQSGRLSTLRQSKSSLSSFSTPLSSLSVDPSDGGQEIFDNYNKEDEHFAEAESQASQSAKRLSVQERISLFESKQKESSGSGSKVVGKLPVLRRLSSDASTPAFLEKAVLRRWSAASEMSMDLTSDKDLESPLSMSSSGSHIYPSSSVAGKSLADTVAPLKPAVQTSSHVQTTSSTVEVAPQGKRNKVASDSLPSVKKAQERHVVNDITKNGFEARENDFGSATLGSPKPKLKKQISGLEPIKNDAQMGRIQRASKAGDQQEVNMGLKMEASEFVEDKFHTPVDKKTVSQKSTSSELQAEKAMEAPEHQISEFQVDGSRGKFYSKYMQKRDAKLREEWGSKRAEKDAKMKAMHDSLEKSREAMKAKYVSGDMLDPTLSARKRAEKLRSFNTRSTKPVSPPMNNEDEDPSGLLDKKPTGEDSASGTPNSRKATLNKSSSSSTPRASALPLIKPPVKSSNSAPARRRENPLAQSVPNFADMKKENTKPSSTGNKMAARAPARNSSRSKGTGEDSMTSKEEKPRSSQSVKKVSSVMDDAKQASSSSPENVVLSPLKLDGEQSESSLRNTLPGSIQEGVVHHGPNYLMSPESVEPKTVNPDGVVKRNLGRLLAENFSDVDEELLNPIQGSDVVAKSGLNSDGVERCAYVVGPTPLGCVQDSPGESPVSWHSRAHVSDVDLSVESPVDSPGWSIASLGNAEGGDVRSRKHWGSAQKPIVVASASQSQSRKDVKKGFKRLLKFGRKTRGAESLPDWISATTSEGDDDTEDGRDPASRSSEDMRKSRMGFSQTHPSEDGFNEMEFCSDQDQSMNSSSIPAPPVNFKLREDLASGSSLKAPRSFFSLSTFRSKASDSKAR